MMQVNGTAVQILRERTGLSLRDLAAAAGIGFKTIHDIERGLTKHPSPSTVKALARGLNVPLTAIIVPIHGETDDEIVGVPA